MRVRAVSNIVASFNIIASIPPAAEATVIFIQMKKIFAYCVFLLAISIILLVAVGFGVGQYVNYKASKIHTEYMNVLNQDFTKGISLEEVKAKFPKYGAEFNCLECSEDNFSKDSCPDEFRTHISIPLEGNLILGEGGVYIYFYFTKDKKLSSYEHYVDYHRFH